MKQSTYKICCTIILATEFIATALILLDLIKFSYFGVISIGNIFAILLLILWG